MLVNYDKRTLAGVTAAVVTTAAFAKLFVPFYLIGSTAIFAVASVLGAMLIAVSWRPICAMASKVSDILLLVGAFYVVVIANFLLLSRPAVPTTHLIGILIFHALYMIFGFAAARALKAVMLLFLAAATVYVIVIAQHTIRFGDVMRGGALNDILGVGDPNIAIAFHQPIGLMLALAMLAAFGLGSNRIRLIVAGIALPLVLLFMFHIAARTALVALACSLAFLMGSFLWIRSKSFTVLGAIALVLIITVTATLFYQRALQDKNVDPKAPDAISRTIREIQDPDPGFRLPIWTKTWQRILAEPDSLVFGRGIGMYPVHEGVGAPDWVLSKAAASKHYPHNVHLEMLYETGIVGLLLFSIVTLFPLGVALTYWHRLSLVEKCAVSMYVFQLAGSELSGAFAFQFLNWFFFALTVGIVAMKRMEGATAAGRPSGNHAEIDGATRLSSGTASATNNPV
jgi:O-antigen ligase